MTEKRKNEIINGLAESLQDRDYGKFVSYFEEKAVFEIPFAVNGGTTHKGLPEIKKHFESLAENPWEKFIRVEEVMTRVYHSGETTTVEYFTKGRIANTGEVFHIQSSVALIRFGESGIVYYKDIPNTIGIAKKAGVLDQFADSLK